MKKKKKTSSFVKARRILKKEEKKSFNNANISVYCMCVSLLKKALFVCMCL